MRLVVLDATAGNRSMWPNKNPPGVIFLDKEFGLSLPPDIFASFEKLPFRDDVFELSLFDPPNLIDRGFLNPWFSDPKGKGGPKGTFYGSYKSRRDLIISIIKAAPELYRVSRRLCFKWFEDRVSLMQVLSLFRPWRMIYKVNPRSRMGRRAWRKFSKKTWWVTFSREKEAEK